MSQHTSAGRQRGMRWRPALALACLAPLAVLGAGCRADASDDAEQGRQVHVDGRGPLSATSGIGGKALWQPPHDPWFASYGSYLLCSTRRGADIRIERVRYRADPQPLAVTPLLRHVPSAAERDGDPMQWNPIGGVIGRRGDYPSGPHPGRFTADLTGFRVTAPCPSPRTPDDAFSELVLEMKIGAEGARVRRTYLDYTADGRPYTLVIRWNMVACGTDLAATMFCRDQPAGR